MEGNNACSARQDISNTGMHRERRKKALIDVAVVTVINTALCTNLRKTQMNEIRENP